MDTTATRCAAAAFMIDCQQSLPTPVFPSPAQGACHAGRKADPTPEMIVDKTKFEFNRPVRRRQTARHGRQRSALRRHDDGAKTQARADAEETGEEMVEWVRAPDMAIGARRLGHLRGRLEAQRRELTPGIETILQAITQIALRIGFEDIMAEVDGRLGQVRPPAQGVGDSPDAALVQPPCPRQSRGNSPHASAGRRGSHSAR